MDGYGIRMIGAYDVRALKEADTLLKSEGITRDANLDYLCALYDEEEKMIAVGGCFGPTLRCLAVSRAHRSEGLLNILVSHLIQYQYNRGYSHLFVCTKAKTSGFFRELGFYEVARAAEDPPEITPVFLENRRRGFSDYLASLGDPQTGIRQASIVMNANPFTIGHRYLIETAAACCDRLHLFLLSEDVGLIPFSIRKKLVQEGIADLKNVVLHESGPYIISSALFPSYFFKDRRSVVSGHARLDTAVFVRIAQRLGITDRFVGSEPLSQTTEEYHAVMAKFLPASGIRFHILERKTVKENPISASFARKAIQDGDWKTFGTLVPETTLRFFMSKEAEPIIKRIRMAGNVRHD